MIKERLYPPDALNHNSLLEYDPERKLIYWQLENFVAEKEFIETAIAGRDFIVKNYREGKILNWLNITDKFKGVSDNGAVMDLREILNKPIAQLVEDTGIRFKVAFLECENLVGSLAIERYKSFTQYENKDSMKIKSFKSIKEAEEWLIKPLESKKKPVIKPVSFATKIYNLINGDKLNYGNL